MEKCFHSIYSFACHCRCFFFLSLVVFVGEGPWHGIPRKMKSFLAPNFLSQCFSYCSFHNNFVVFSFSHSCVGPIHYYYCALYHFVSNWYESLAPTGFPPLFSPVGWIANNKTMSFWTFSFVTVNTTCEPIKRLCQFQGFLISFCIRASNSKLHLLPNDININKNFSSFWHWFVW